MIELADVNVLVALIWERHLHHAAARRWFAELVDRPGGRLATCAATQIGFVRVSSNPVVLDDAVSVREATAVLSALVEHPAHRFVPDEAGYVGNPLVPHDRLVGHRQVTDAHLIGVARASGVVVATFDRGMAALGADDVRLIAN